MRPTRQAPLQWLRPQVRSVRCSTNHFFRDQETPRWLSSPFFSCWPEMSRPTQSLAATPAARTSVDLTHQSLFYASLRNLHKRPRYIGVSCSQQPLSWRCPIHGEPGPPVTTLAFYACNNVTTRSGLTQNCTNLAHAVKRCSKPTAPPEQ